MKTPSLLVLTVLTGLGFLLVYCGNPSIEKQPETTQAEEVVTVDYLKLGAKIAGSTKDALGKQLIRAISTLGTVGAIGFCNLQAIPLTDSTALAHNAKVKRVSDKARNPDNQANEKELAILMEWKDQQAKGDSITARLIEVDGKMIGYYPIKTNGMCLQCHGIPGKDIHPDVMAAIQKNYPNDKATGYGADQLRGIFVIQMDKK
ncbi:MAG: Tll0287-like domain-containing protein [Bacteroidia bacterium]